MILFYQVVLRADSIARILVIGPSGSGKTFISETLQKEGINAVDADTIVGLHSWYSRGRKVKRPEKLTKTFIRSHSFLWDRVFLVKYLKNKPNIYLFGLSGNIFDATDLFDRVYFLKVDSNVIIKRLVHPNRKNDMGKKKYQQKAVISYKKMIEEKAKSLGIPFVDGHLTPKEIFERISS